MIKKNSIKSWRELSLIVSSLLFIALIFFACKKNNETDPVQNPVSEKGEELPVDYLSVYDESENAYNHAIPGLSDADQVLFVVGNSFNRMNWVTAPSSATATDGLGPLFNARSCSGCHSLDGRGQPPLPGNEPVSMVFRLSESGTDAHGGPLPVANFGDQLSNFSILGVDDEGSVNISYEEMPGEYPDGTPYSLRRPTYTFENGSLSSVLFSPRVAPKMSGTGFIDAIPEALILAHADENDENQDGISGRPNYVWNYYTNQVELGRIGWKANQPNVKQQVAHAFLNDIGITSSIAPEQNLWGSQITNYGNLPNGGVPEIPDSTLSKVYFYTSMLSLPARSKAFEGDVLKGKTLFNQLGCSKCHVPNMYTSAHPDFPVLNGLNIHPYSDFLLHDMGPGLEDGRPDYLASGREWRTSPLWGISKQQVVNDHLFLLHDGRARGFEEAILWHGGEAYTIKNAFMNLSKQDRERVLTFLNSL